MAQKHQPEITGYYPGDPIDVKTETSAFSKKVKAEFMKVQDAICQMLVEEGAKSETYKEDVWKYEKGDGGGRTRVWGAPADMTKNLENGGVNFSYITGDSLPPSAATKWNIPPGTCYTATGVSLVIHPRNPHVPTIHMNIRYFEAGEVWWFGGGIDLTPYYPRLGDVQGFHEILRDVCNAHDMPYEQFKIDCDEYFTLGHRNETRGVGGLFADHMQGDRERILRFLAALGYAFVDCYRPFLQKYATHPYTKHQRNYQLWKRGRYVEFNLLYDRGTKFGIQSGGRAESILMSLPAVTMWRYQGDPPSHSIEGRLIAFYNHPQNWFELKASDAPISDKEIEIMSGAAEQFPDDESLIEYYPNRGHFCTIGRLRRWQMDHSGHCKGMMILQASAYTAVAVAAFAVIRKWWS